MRNKNVFRGMEDWSSLLKGIIKPILMYASETLMYTSRKIGRVQAVKMDLPSFECGIRTVKRMKNEDVRWQNIKEKRTVEK